jgi:hypothetical protein
LARPICARPAVASQSCRPEAVQRGPRGLLPRSVGRGRTRIAPQLS